MDLLLPLFFFGLFLGWVMFMQSRGGIAYGNPENHARGKALQVLAKKESFALERSAPTHLISKVKKYNLGYPNPAAVSNLILLPLNGRKAFIFDYSYKVQESTGSQNYSASCIPFRNSRFPMFTVSRPNAIRIGGDLITKKQLPEWMSNFEVRSVSSDPKTIKMFLDANKNILKLIEAPYFFMLGVHRNYVMVYFHEIKADENYFRSIRGRREYWWDYRWTIDFLPCSIRGDSFCCRYFLFDVRSKCFFLFIDPKTRASTSRRRLTRFSL